MTRAQALVEFLLETDSLDSLEGGDFRNAYDYELRGDGPPVKPSWHLGHRSSRQALNRNLRGRSFGRTDNYSLRDRGWPYVNRGFDAKMKKYERKLKRFGEVTPGEGI
jgi:hypothetical protein